MSIMTRQQFKKRWEGDDNGGGITNEHIAECAVEWGLCSKPKTMRIDQVVYMVVKEADTNDHEQYNHANEDDL